MPIPGRFNRSSPLCNKSNSVYETHLVAMNPRVGALSHFDRPKAVLVAEAVMEIRPQNRVMDICICQYGSIRRYFG